MSADPAAPGAGGPPPRWARRLAYAAYVLLVFFGVALLVDVPLSRALTGWPEAERQLFRWITRLGDSGWILIPSLVLGLLGLAAARLAPLRYGWRWLAAAVGGIGAFVFVGVGLPGLVVVILKRILGRARPEHIDLLGPLSFRPITLEQSLLSFPSGHANTAAAFAVVLVALCGRGWRFAVFGIAGLVAFSRIVVGAHYLTDVVAGFALGVIVASLVREWFAARRLVLERRDGHLRNRLWPVVARAWRRWRA